MSISFTAYGKPITQGSVRSLGKGRPSIHSNAATLLPWRDQIVSAVLRACYERDQGDPAREPDRVSGPVAVSAVFAFDPPKKHTGMPITRSSGDLDKLCRALLDGIVQSGYLRDDSQVVTLMARKVWSGALVGLDRPGAFVTVSELRP